MRNLLIATTNPGKFNELKKALRDIPTKTFSLRDFPKIKLVEETGETFEKNAELKARGYGEQTGLPTIADDGGLEIDALNGEPGIKSHRWLSSNRESTDKELIIYALDRLRGVPREKRGARLRTVVAFYDVINGKVYLESESVSGYIVEEMPDDVIPGFPFRSLLFIPQFGKLYKDLTEEEHRGINHRLKALGRLKPKILKSLD
jgi:XTP/dITP diphosphohydrolase